MSRGGNGLLFLRIAHRAGVRCHARRFAGGRSGDCARVPAVLVIVPFLLAVPAGGGVPVMRIARCPLLRIAVPRCGYDFRFGGRTHRAGVGFFARLRAGRGGGYFAAVPRVLGVAVLFPCVFTGCFVPVVGGVISPPRPIRMLVPAGGKRRRRTRAGAYGKQDDDFLFEFHAS